MLNIPCRGRSRQVSNTALARQASEERRVVFAPMAQIVLPPFTRSGSSSPSSSSSMSPDYYDSPPSPPRSLEDQVHVAYALDDIHLAKILLLRLKGIQVTSDDDPRIAAVQDEDFDFCFVPNGRLMDEQDEKAVYEMQQRELKRIQEQRRLDHLRRCERKFRDEKKRQRDEKIAILRRRERRRQEEEERRKFEEQERRREDEQRRVGRHRTRQVVNYDCLKASSSKSHADGRQFVYDCMPSPVAKPAPLPRSTTPPILHSKPFALPVFDDSRAIPFTDVLKSMQGPLFPPSDDERIHRSDSRLYNRSRSRPAKRNANLDLLESLLAQSDCSEAQFRNCKGKQRAQPRRSVPCPACLDSPTTPDTPASLPRTSSWLSFRPSSPFTDSTSLSSSPRSSWFSKPKSWINVSESSTTPRTRHSCHPSTRLTPVNLSDSPLFVDQPPSASLSFAISYPGQQRSTNVKVARESAGLLVRRMSRFVEIAKGFQSSYVNVAMFSVTASHESFESREISSDDMDWTRRSKQDSSCQSLVQTTRPRLRPAGYRASCNDIAVFLKSTAPPSLELSSTDGSSGASSQTTSPAPRYIPLVSPFPPTEPPRTILPDPLPYQLHFKPLPPPVRSPSMFYGLSELHTMYPCPVSSTASNQSLAAGQTQVTWRIRSVGNPAYLRLKALHTIVWKRGIVWEGIGRETALGGGRERVMGVAYDGVGGSSLGRG